jgi:hypothetical protein
MTDKIDYEKYPAIISEYKGVTFRSKLEKKWAMMFDYLYWNWQYEPFEIDKYTPDFLVEIGSKKWVVEVKPIINPNEKYQKRLLNITKKTSYEGCILLYSDIFNVEYPFYFIVPPSFASIYKNIHDFDTDIVVTEYKTFTIKIGIMCIVKNKWGFNNNDWGNCLLGFYAGWKPKIIIKKDYKETGAISDIDKEFLPTDNNNDILIYWKSLNKQL